MKTPIQLACAILAFVACGTVVSQTQSSKPELKPIAFTTLDTNKDGKISANEARAAPDLFASFDMLDINHDGFLSPAEFQAWTRALKVSDAPARDPATVPGGSAGAQHMPPTN